MALGVYPAVTLLAARKARDEIKEQLRGGLDPSHEKKRVKLQRSLDRANFNRLRDPESKLGIARWLEGALVPGVPAESVTHQRLLRTMDTVVEHADALDDALAGLPRLLIDQELSILFYDLTTIRTEGHSRTDNNELRQFGLAKEGDIARQVMLGVV